MKKSNYLIALALGASTITFAQNVGINTDGSDPDSDAILHINNHSGSSADSSIIRIENEQNGANDVTGVEIYNSGTGATAKWDVYIPASGSTDLRIKNNGTDRITIQNDGDVGIGISSPSHALDVNGTVEAYAPSSGGNVMIWASSDGARNSILSVPADGDGTAPFIYSTNNAYRWLVDAINTLEINSNGVVTINQDGTSDQDFRVEGDTDTEIFMVDASADAVGISTTTPKSTLDIQGSMGLNVTTITANTTLDQTHNVVLCNTGPYTVTLPAAASNTDKVYYIKNIDSDGDDITIDGNGDNIEGLSTIVLESYKDVIRIISDGDNWYILEKSLKVDCGTSTVSWTYNGGSVTYGTVLSSTGKCWLDRNLGASQVATSSTDYLAYGDLFQWGRADDGHQEITWTNSTTGSAVNGTTTSNADTPGDALFITPINDPYDWRDNRDDNLWNGESATNNPCPSGWRIPTSAEWSSELTSESITNAATAYSSVLKLPMAGRRDHNGGGSLSRVGTDGYYWSSTVSGTWASRLYFNSSVAGMYAYYRAFGHSVRCLKD